MNSPELYESRSSTQFNDAATVLSQFKSKLQWEDNETIMDIGCGPGNVTAKLLQPMLPNDATIVGVDISPNMIEHAQKKYSNKNLHFRKVDFGSESVRQVFECESFTKIFSFYCLQLIPDQRRYIENLRSLLKPNGSALIVIVANCPLYTVYKALSKLEEWAPYMRDVDTYISPYQEAQNPSDDYRKLLQDCGLRVSDCFVKDTTFDGPTCDYIKETLLAINPFRSRMPENLRNKYMDTLMEALLENHIIRNEGSEGKVTYILPCQLVVALSQKIS